MDSLANLQALQAYFQLQNAAATTMPAAPPTPLLNPSILNSADINTLTTLALIYANQNNVNNQIQQHVAPLPPVPITTAPPSTFHQQQQQTIAAPTFNINTEHLTNQLLQQNTLNQLSQLFGMSISPQQPQSQQQPLFPQHLSHTQHQQFNATIPASAYQNPVTMPKPQVTFPKTSSKPIPIPSKPQMIQPSKHSLPTTLTGTPERKRRRHPDIEMLSQPQSLSGSPINDKLARSRAFTYPNAMKANTQMINKEELKNPTIDKVAKFVDQPSSSSSSSSASSSSSQGTFQSSSANNNIEAILLAKTAYVLNALGESAYRQSDPALDENSANEEMEVSEGDHGHVIKIPLPEIHRMIEDCYNST